MNTVPLTRTRSQLIADVQHRMRDDGSRRWDRREVVRAINDALLPWSTRVYTPLIYTISGGWVAGQYEYPLPNYITRHVQPQRRVLTPYLQNDGSGSNQYVWADVSGFSIEPDGEGGQLLRTDFNEGTVGAEADARLIWWMHNGPLPDPSSGEDPALASDMTASATSMAVSGVLDVGAAGYVKVGQELIQYAGVTTDGSNTTLSNLVRGAGDTTAAIHTTGDSVEWCIAVQTPTLWQQLYFQAMAHLHALVLTEAPARESEHHQWAMRWHQQAADDFWKQYTPARGPRLILGRRAVGFSTF